MPIASNIKLVECPRDAMQGIEDFIPTESKAEYINLLLKVGFHTLDFGSFVSAKAIPQMRDTADLVKKLNLSSTKTKLLVIVANKRGAEDASAFEEIDVLGFPFSVSETFQQRNTNSSISESLSRVEAIGNLCGKKNKELVIYLSMGFGNPYGDLWNMEILNEWADALVQRGVQILSLADTIGVSTPASIAAIYPALQQNLPEVEWGMHLHSNPKNSSEKIKAAFEAGCSRFDSALKGFGGCPMAADELTGNIATENVLSYLKSNSIQMDIDEERWKEALIFSEQLFK